MNGMGYIDSDISGLGFVIRAELDPADDIQIRTVNVGLDTTSESFTNTDFHGASDNMIADDTDDDATPVEIGGLEQYRKVRGRPLSSSTKRRGRRSSKRSKRSPNSLKTNKEACEEIISSINLCQNYDQDFNNGAIVIDDINDLVFRFVTQLPMGCWLELDAHYPTGKFYLPGLSVNKLLNMTAKNLNDLLASNDSLLGRNGSLSHIIFSHKSYGRLSRPDGTHARWIYLDLTGQRPHEGPGDRICLFQTSYFVHQFFSRL